MGWFERQRIADDRLAAAADPDLLAEKAAIRAERAAMMAPHHEAALAYVATRERLHAQPVETAVETLKRLSPDALADFLKIVNCRFDWSAFRTELQKLHRAQEATR